MQCCLTMDVKALHRITCRERAEFEGLSANWEQLPKKLSLQHRFHLVGRQSPAMMKAHRVVLFHVFF